MTHISNEGSLCNRNMNTCEYFIYKMVHYGIWGWCIMGFVQQIYLPIGSLLSCPHTLLNDCVYLRTMWNNATRLHMRLIVSLVIQTNTVNNNVYNIYIYCVMEIDKIVGNISIHTYQWILLKKFTSFEIRISIWVMCLVDFWLYPIVIND